MLLIGQHHQWLSRTTVISVTHLSASHLTLRIQISSVWRIVCKIIENCVHYLLKWILSLVGCHQMISLLFCLAADACLSRGVYSGKSDCLVLPKNKSFYGKPAKTVMFLDWKVAKNLWRSRVSTKQRPDLDSACLKTPITTFCLTILINWNFS